MYLGFFFIHWAKSESKVVWQSDPVNLESCPFCNKISSAIYKIYNTKHKHYSSFSIGKGNFNATFVCRNCASEGELGKDLESYLIKGYLLGIQYDDITKQYDKNPEKSIKKLEKIIKKSISLKIRCDVQAETLSRWTNDKSAIMVSYRKFLETISVEKPVEVTSSSDALSQEVIDSSDGNQEETNKKIEKIDDFLLRQAKMLLELRVGDIGRLKHICDTLRDGKKLYNSDRRYLEEVLEEHSGFSQNEGMV